ncbi:MAG: transposase [Christensenellales bacterium]
MFSGTKYRRCTVHFYHNVFSAVPCPCINLVTRKLKTIHAQERKQAAREKVGQAAKTLHSMKLKETAKRPRTA